MSAWWKNKDGEYKEYEWRLADTGEDAIKLGCTIYPNPKDKKQLMAMDRQGIEHELILFNITDNAKEINK